MKILLIILVLGVGVLLTGCFPVFVERHHDHAYYDDYRNGYYGNGYRRGSGRIDVTPVIEVRP